MEMNWDEEDTSNENDDEIDPYDRSRDTDSSGMGSGSSGAGIGHTGGQSIYKTLEDLLNRALGEKESLKFSEEIMVEAKNTIYKMEETMTEQDMHCLLYTSPSPRDRQKSRMPSSA